MSPTTTPTPVGRLAIMAEIRRTAASVAGKAQLITEASADILADYTIGNADLVELLGKLSTADAALEEMG